MKWIGLFLLNLLAFPATPLLFIWHPAFVPWQAIAALSCVSAPMLMLLALPFARRTGETVLPGWLAWLNTPDDPGPMQGMYESQVKLVEKDAEDIAAIVDKVTSIQKRFGWYVKTWYWLGIRNQCYGLFAALCGRYNGAKVSETFCWKFKIYSVPGYREITWPGRRVSFGYKVQTLKTAKTGDPIWWVCQPSFWKARAY
jgi:hypothetical protein